MKRLIVCSDGTWNTPESDTPTNVIKLTRAISPIGKKKVPQIVFYDWGIGTDKYLDGFVGGAFGDGLDKNIQDGYRFLVHNYSPGDEIYLFGFSRGAYTARSLGGFIRNSGVLKKSEAHRIPKAFDHYRDSTWHPTHKRAKDFRKKHSYEPKIKFIGVWDTVGALGIPGGIFKGVRKKYKFHDLGLSSIIQNAFHALAIDERRKDFKASLWSNEPGPGQVVEQVWFAGVHSDVGGGYKEHYFSDIALDWMVQKAVDCDLKFNAAYLKDVSWKKGIHEIQDSRTGPFIWRPAKSRKIGKQTNESIHQSALDLYDDVESDYQPSNLRKHLDMAHE